MVMESSRSTCKVAGKITISFLNRFQCMQCFNIAQSNPFTYFIDFTFQIDDTKINKNDCICPNVKNTPENYKCEMLNNCKII